MSELVRLALLLSEDERNPQKGTRPTRNNLCESPDRPPSRPTRQGCSGRHQVSLEGDLIEFFVRYCLSRPKNRLAKIQSDLPV